MYSSKHARENVIREKWDDSVLLRIRLRVCCIVTQQNFLDYSFVCVFTSVIISQSDIKINTKIKLKIINIYQSLKT